MISILSQFLGITRLLILASLLISAIKGSCHARYVSSDYLTRLTLSPLPISAIKGQVIITTSILGFVSRVDEANLKPQKGTDEIEL